jgi:hypothetical protein
LAKAVVLKGESMRKPKSIANLLGIAVLLTVSAVAILLLARRAELASAPASAPPPVTVSPLPAYSTRGRGTMTVDGPGCCDGVVFPSAFEMDYEADELSGSVRITRLQAALADMDITFRFLIFETGRVQIRCGVARSESVIAGNADGSGNLTIAAGAATLSGQSVQTREASGDCGGGRSTISLTNNSPITGLLDPAGNHVTITGAFTTTTEGRTYNVTLNLAGEYTNHPPVALIGVEGVGLEAFAQGGCPAVMNGGNPPEPSVEANDPAGLKMVLRSFSRDPDGPWSGADIQMDQWFHGRDSEPTKFIGESRRFGPMLFEFGSMHHLTLQTTDRAGVSSTSDCNFRVVDRTPPTVTAPVSTVIDATLVDGATPITSPALRSFLASAIATDLGDAAPIRLPPLLNGNVVKDDTLFPIDPAGPPEEWLNVTFRFADRFGNVGSTTSSVRVIAPKK